MIEFDDFNFKNSLSLTLLICMSNFMLSRVEHEKGFITSGPGRLALVVPLRTNFSVFIFIVCHYQCRY